MSKLSNPTAPSSRRTRAIDPQMRPLRWAHKGHSRDGRMFLALRAELMAHIGGKPSATQRALIDRLAWLQLHIAKMDERSNHPPRAAVVTGADWRGGQAA